MPRDTLLKKIVGFSALALLLCYAAPDCAKDYSAPLREFRRAIERDPRHVDLELVGSLAGFESAARGSANQNHVTLARDVTGLALIYSNLRNLLGFSGPREFFADIRNDRGWLLNARERLQDLLIRYAASPGEEADDVRAIAHKLHIVVEDYLHILDMYERIEQLHQTVDQALAGENSANPQALENESELIFARIIRIHRTPIFENIYGEIRAEQLATAAYTRVTIITIIAKYYGQRVQNALEAARRAGQRHVSELPTAGLRDDESDLIARAIAFLTREGANHDLDAEIAAYVEPAVRLGHSLQQLQEIATEFTRIARAQESGDAPHGDALNLLRNLRNLIDRINELRVGRSLEDARRNLATMVLEYVVAFHEQQQARLILRIVRIEQQRELGRAIALPRPSLFALFLRGWLLS